MVVRMIVMRSEVFVVCWYAGHGIGPLLNGLNRP